jgi:hypothetical protein
MAFKGGAVTWAMCWRVPRGEKEWWRGGGSGPDLQAAPWPAGEGRWRGHAAWAVQARTDRGNGC